MSVLTSPVQLPRQSPVQDSKDLHKKDEIKVVYGDKDSIMFVDTNLSDHTFPSTDASCEIKEIKCFSGKKTSYGKEIENVKNNSNYDVCV